MIVSLGIVLELVHTADDDVRVVEEFVAATCADGD